MEITLSIIGTAGRKDDEKRLSKHHFEAMCIVASGLLDQFKDSNYSVTTLVSGGAAWGDHVAVNLFLNKKVPRLRLFIPCNWNGNGFHDNKIKNDAKRNPGGIANHYHDIFHRKTNINSLSQIQIAQNEGAELIPVIPKGNQSGFFARNALVAKSDFLLACTFGNGAEVKDGGTAHTVKLYLDRVKREGSFDKSFHYDLNSGGIFSGCRLSDEWLQSFKQAGQHLVG